VESPGKRQREAIPLVESLEGRQLLSFFTGASANRPVHARAGAFLIQVSGPGLVNAHPAGKGAIDLIAYGTSVDTTITITQTQPRFHFANRFLPIHNLIVKSGQLGGLGAPTVELTGRMTPLNASVNILDLGALGPKAQVDVAGSVGAMSVGTIDLGPTGHVVISGDLNSAVAGGSQSSLATIGSMTTGTMNLDGGRFLIGRDSMVPITVQGDLTISHDGQFVIGRDQDGAFAINGSLRLNSGGQLVVGRNLDNLIVNGNLLVTPNGSGIAVNGALNGLTVNGFFQGQGGTSNPTAIDLGVGLNLTGLRILGGVTGQGGLINANIRAGGSVSNVSIPYGTINSTIKSNTPP
jgi:hypothetical protein